MNPHFTTFRKKILSPVFYRLFLLQKLPLVYFTGIKIKHLDENGCTTIARYGWLNQNPFRSMYFAVMNMAAELSTGVLCMGNIYGREPGVSMLVVKTEARYFKKAVGTILFTCTDGKTIAEAIARTLASCEGETVECVSVATNEANEVVGEFRITWSLKAKTNR